MTTFEIEEILGAEAGELLAFDAPAISKEKLHLPSAKFIDDIFMQSNRSIQVLRNLIGLYNHGRLAGTGYLSILPVDQGVEHTAGASFAVNPNYFDPENIMRLAIEGGCSAVATTFGNFGLVARKYAAKIPFIVKINHNELLTYPTKYDQILFGNVQQAWDMGAAAIGATIFFGSQQSGRQITEVALAFEQAHQLGLPCILWCYARNEKFSKNGINYEIAADITGQANHLGATIQADIIKQKLPEINGGFHSIGFSKSSPRMYEKLCSDHPIDLCRYQLLNCYMGRVGLINSGGESKGENDLAQAVRTAVINKRAGGTGLILGRKAFQRPEDEAIKLLHAVQDVYLNKEITIA